MKIKYTLLAMAALMVAPKGFSENSLLEDVVNHIENSEMNLEQTKDYALSMLFELDPNDETESVTNAILSSDQKDDLVNALRQYAGSKKNESRSILDSLKGGTRFGPTRKREEKENEKNKNMLSKLEKSYETKNPTLEKSQKALLRGLLLELKRNTGPESEGLFADKKEFLEEVMNQLGGDVPDIKKLGFKDRWDIVNKVIQHYGLPQIYRGG